MKNNLISFIPKHCMAILSSPIPKASPENSSGLISTLRKTFGCTIPQPNNSINPVFLQVLQPEPPQIKQVTSISALGSVNGK